MNNAKETRDKATGNANKEEEDLGDKTEDNLKDDGKLATKTKGNDNAVAGSQDLEDENVDEGEDAVKLAALDLEAGGTGERGDDSGKADLKLLDVTSDGLKAGLLLDVAGLNAGDSRVCIIG